MQGSFLVQWFSKWGPRTRRTVRILIGSSQAQPRPTNQKPWTQQACLHRPSSGPDAWDSLRTTGFFLPCYRSVKALATLLFPVRESAANTSTWTAWACHHPPMESSSVLSVKLVSIPILVDRGWRVGVWRASVSSDGALPYAFTELESLLP